MQRGVPEQFDGHYHYFTDESFQALFSDLVIRIYGEGVQRPAQLAVFQKRRLIEKLEKDGTE